jgi:hypothetical protein
MKGTLKKIIPALLFSISLPLLAQVESDADRDRKYTPNQSSVFNELGKKKGPSSTGTEIDIKNSIQFCPTILARQKVLFIYERALGDIVSMNFGLGKAFGNDFMQSTYFSAFSDFDSDNYLDPGTILLNADYAGSSMLLQVGLKVYFSGSSFDGSFMEFQYRRERLDYKLNPTVYGNRIENGNTAEFKMNAFSFGYGYKETTGINQNFTHEFFFNAGIKNFSFTKFNEIIRSNSSNNETVYQRSPLEADARILPSINIGYIFGFGF